MLAGRSADLDLGRANQPLDLPSIEELENRLARYSGAIIYVSHDSYFSKKINWTADQYSLSAVLQVSIWLNLHQNYSDKLHLYDQGMGELLTNGYYKRFLDQLFT